MRGLNRRLYRHEKLVLNHLFLDIMDAEFTPLDMAKLFLGDGSSSRDSASDPDD